MRVRRRKNWPEIIGDFLRCMGVLNSIRGASEAEISAQLSALAGFEPLDYNQIQASA